MNWFRGFSWEAEEAPPRVVIKGLLPVPDYCVLPDRLPLFCDLLVVKQLEANLLVSYIRSV